MCDLKNEQQSSEKNFETDTTFANIKLTWCKQGQEIGSFCFNKQKLQLQYSKVIENQVPIN